MSIRYWIFAAAFGLISLLHPQETWSQVATEPQPGKKEGTAASGDGGQYQQPAPIDLTPALERIEAAIRELIAEEDKIARKQGEQREKRDLDAQEGMAHWAEWMFYATAATVFLTFVALVAIVRTLHHTKRAANYAEDMVIEAHATTKAAEKTVEATHEVARTELKAYVGVKSVTISFGRDGRHFTAETVIIVANSGSTPAIIPFLGAIQEIKLLDADVADMGGQGHSNHNDRILGPNSEFPVRVGVGAMRRLLEAPKMSFKIGFLIRYRDIYGEERIEASRWVHRAIATNSIKDGMVVELFPLMQTPYYLDGLTEESWA